LAKYHPSPDDIFEEEMGTLSSNINKAVRDLARVDWRFNTSIHKKMNQALDDLIWDFSEEHGLDLPVEQIDLLLENIMKTAMSRY
jgi:type I restriction enzyme R subunit